jgi:hypothetical protein
MAEYEEPNKKRIGLLQTNSIMIGAISPLHSQLQNHDQWASCRQPKNNPEKGQINRPKTVQVESSAKVYFGGIGQGEAAFPLEEDKTSTPSACSG